MIFFYHRLVLPVIVFQVFFKNLFIYFGCAVSQSWHGGSLLPHGGIFQLQHADSQLWHACGIQFPHQGSNPGPLHWERRVLPTGPPGKSQYFSFKKGREKENLRKMPIVLPYARHCSKVLQKYYVTYSYQYFEQGSSIFSILQIKKTEM